MSEAGGKRSILGIGLDPVAISKLNEFWAKEKIVTLSTRVGLEDLIENPGKIEFSGAFCGDQLRDITPAEIAQGFRIAFPEIPIFFISKDRTRFSRTELLKNGFHDALIEPFDETLLDKIFSDISGIARESLQPDRFAPIRLVDVQPDTVLDFHIWIYLPLNKKHVRILQSGQKMPAERLERIKNHDISSVFIIREELPKFYKYTANRLHELSKGGLPGENETQVKERLQGSIRNLFTSIFDEAASSNISAGKALMIQCQEIVGTYIKDNMKNEWYLKVRNAISDSNNQYSHSLAVSTLVALFSIGTGIGKADELAIAGILHDIGMIEIPQAVQNKSAAERTFEEHQIYSTHPQASVNFIKTKKLLVSEDCLRAILEHHERFDGKGFPKKKYEKQISPSAQILSLADEFDYLTRIEPGKPYMTAMDAFFKLKTSGAYDPRLMDQIFKLLPG